MVFAFEPKFVIEGSGAVGIENSFRVTTEGLEKLTRFLTQLTQQQANVLGFLFGNLLDTDWMDLPRLMAMVMVGLIFLKWI